MDKKKLSGKIMPAGYHIKVLSWENDEEEYMEKEHVVPNIEYLRYLMEFLNLFQANCENDVHTFGNKNVSINEFFEYLENYRTPLSHFLKKSSFTTKLIESFVFWDWFSLIGYWFDGGRVFRVFQRAEIFYVPEDLIFDRITCF